MVAHMACPLWLKWLITQLTWMTNGIYFDLIIILIDMDAKWHVDYDYYD
jgi:hypothetical protein